MCQAGGEPTVFANSEHPTPVGCLLFVNPCRPVRPHVGPAVLAPPSPPPMYGVLLKEGVGDYDALMRALKTSVIFCSLIGPPHFRKMSPSGVRNTVVGMNWTSYWTGTSALEEVPVGYAIPSSWSKDLPSSTEPRSIEGPMSSPRSRNCSLCRS